MSHIEKKVGKKSGLTWKVDILLKNDKLSVYEKDGTISSIWKSDIEKENDDGSKEGVIYQTEFSGILTGNLGKSYTYAKPVTEVMKESLREFQSFSF